MKMKESKYSSKCPKISKNVAAVWAFIVLKETGIDYDL